MGNTLVRSQERAEQRRERERKRERIIKLLKESESSLWENLVESVSSVKVVQEKLLRRWQQSTKHQETLEKDRKEWVDDVESFRKTFVYHHTNLMDTHPPIKEVVGKILEFFEGAIDKLLKDLEDEVEKIRKAIEHWERLIDDHVNPSYTAAAA